MTPNTISELLAGKRPRLPALKPPYGTATKAAPKVEQLGFDLDSGDGLV